MSSRGAPAQRKRVLDGFVRAAVAAVLVACSSESVAPVDPPPPPPPELEVIWDPPPAAPVCEEDFTQFGSWAEFVAGARCVSNKARLDSWGRNNVNVTQDGLFYRYRARPELCSDQFSGEGEYRLPPGVREVWVEWTGIFSENWTNENPDCAAPAPDYKYLLVWTNREEVSCGERRADYKLGTFGHLIHASAPGFPECDDVPINHDGSIETVRHPGAEAFFDGQPHRYRMKLAIRDGGVFDVYLDIDGTVTHAYSTQSIQDEGLSWARIALGANRNVGATEDMWVWWSDIRIWAR